MMMKKKKFQVNHQINEIIESRDSMQIYFNLKQSAHSPNNN